jgi:hypothetical protein
MPKPGIRGVGKARRKEVLDHDQSERPLWPPCPFCAATDNVRYHRDSARAALRGPDGLRRECEDAGPDPWRVAGVPHLRNAALVGFSLVGSVLTLIGIYGVLTLSVASRRRELAIRAAVGAERRHIRNLIFAERFRLVAGAWLRVPPRRCFCPASSRLFYLEWGLPTPPHSSASPYCSAEWHCWLAGYPCVGPPEWIRSRQLRYE